MLTYKDTELIIERIRAQKENLSTIGLTRACISEGLELAINIIDTASAAEKQREGYALETLHECIDVNFGDIDASEKLVEKSYMLITYNGKCLQPLYTSSGLVFIQNKYLSPLSDVFDLLEFYERHTPLGQIYIAAKTGLLLQAVIVPANVITEPFVHSMQVLTEQLSLSLNHSQLKAEDKNPEEMGQTSFKVDPETGELIDNTEEAN